MFFFLVGCVDKKVDLDLGNYERFMDIKLTSENNITTGKVYKVCVFVKVMKKVWNVLFLVFLTYTSVNSMCLRKRGEEIILGRLFRYLKLDKRRPCVCWYSWEIERDGRFIESPLWAFFVGCSSYYWCYSKMDWACS